MAGCYNFMEEKVTTERKRWFSEQLLAWNSAENQREMPWKGEKNPYRVWMSEIILQQTRVEQGKAYYEKFISRYPDIAALATADDEEVLKLWEGLGYYSRCRNMISAAREIQNKFSGRFPDDINEILSLPGVGSYTAAAITSFAFDQPHAVLDGNVFRVLSRFFGLFSPIDAPAGRKIFEELSTDLLHNHPPALYNQAIMDFGATICKPRRPLCAECPLAAKCVALTLDKVADLPVKIKKLKRKTRWFNFLIIINSGKVLLEKRGPKDIWEDLYQFPMVESAEVPNAGHWILPGFVQPGNRKEPRFLFQHTQQLTHQTIHGRFFVLKTNIVAETAGMWVEIGDIKQFPFPRMIARILSDHHLWTA